MVNGLSFLYRFVTSPERTILEEDPPFSAVLCVAALCVLSVYSVAGWHFGFFGYVCFLVLGIVLGILGGALLDSVAQLFFRREAQGIRIGYWLIVVQLPGILGFPLAQIFGILQTPQLLWFANLVISVFVVWLEYRLIRVRYQVSSLKGLVLLLSVPVVCFFLVLLALFAGISYMMQVV